MKNLIIVILAMTMCFVIMGPSHASIVTFELVGAGPTYDVSVSVTDDYGTAYFALLETYEGTYGTIAPNTYAWFRDTLVPDLNAKQIGGFTDWRIAADDQELNRYLGNFRGITAQDRRDVFGNHLFFDNSTMEAHEAWTAGDGQAIAGGPAGSMYTMYLSHDGNPYGFPQDETEMPTNNLQGAWIMSYGVTGGGAPIPEPTTILMFGIGAGFGIIRRRFRR